MNTLFKQCNDYIRNEWIIDCASLNKFVKSLVVDGKKPHPSLLFHLPKILNNNEIVKDFSVEVYQFADIWAKHIAYIDVLKCLIESNSFYLREDLIWDMCVQFWKNCSDQLQFSCAICCCKRKICDYNNRCCNNCRRKICFKCFD